MLLTPLILLGEEVEKMLVGFGKDTEGILKHIWALFYCKNNCIHVFFLSKSSPDSPVYFVDQCVFPPEERLEALSKVHHHRILLIPPEKPVQSCHNNRDDIV